MENGKALGVLFPGREVRLDDIGVKATVYPVGIKHLKKFSQQIVVMGSIIGKLEAKVEVKPGMKDEEILEAKLASLRSQIAVHVIPFLLTQALELVSACVKLEPEGITLEDLPHWILPKVAEVWLVESFGDEEKWGPWVAAVDGLIRKATGKDLSISEIFSKLLSGLDTILSKSSVDLPESSHTKVGA